MTNAVLTDDMIVRLFDNVNTLSNNAAIPYSCVDKFMEWDQLNPDNPCDRARLNELRNQAKARINAMAKKGVDSDGNEFSPFQLVVAIHGEEWRKVASSDYTNKVIEKGIRRVDNAFGTMKERASWSNNAFCQDNVQRRLYNEVISGLEFRQKQLKDELNYVASRLKAIRDDEQLLLDLERKEVA